MRATHFARDDDAPKVGRLKSDLRLHNCNRNARTSSRLLPSFGASLPRLMTRPRAAPDLKSLAGVFAMRAWEAARLAFIFALITPAAWAVEPAHETIKGLYLMT